MVTHLQGQLRREIRVGGTAYIVTLTDEGLKLTEKGHRKGYEVSWEDLLNGDAALAAGLHAMLRNGPSRRTTHPAAARPRRPGARRKRR